MSNSLATVLAGVPAVNMTLFHKIRFSVGDSAFFTELPDGKSILLVRDIEMSQCIGQLVSEVMGIGVIGHVGPVGYVPGKDVTVPEIARMLVEVAVTLS